MGTLEMMACGWFLGLWGGYLTGVAPQPAWAVLGMAAAAALGLVQARHDVRERVMPWLFAVLSTSAGLAAGLRVPPAPAPVPSGLARLTVVVQRTQALASGDYESEVVVERGALIDGGQTLASGLRLRLRPFALPEGMRVQTLATLTPIQRYRNDSPHPPWPDAVPIAGYGRLPAFSAFEVISISSPLHATFGRVRQSLREKLQSTLPTSSRGLAVALLLGDMSAVHLELRNVVSNAGLSHVLAVSGLHVSLMAGFLVLLLRFLLLWTPRLAVRLDVTRLSYAFGIPIAASLSLFFGSGPSAQRAAATAAIAWIVRACGARPSATTTLAMSLLLLSAHMPRLVLSPSFVLSIAATAGVLHAADIESHDLVSLLRASLRVSLATTVATAPIVLWCFDNVPIIGLLANLVAVPWSTLVLMPLTVAHGLTSTWFPWLQDLTAFLFDLTARTFVAISEVAYDMSPSVRWPVPNLAQGLLLALMASLFLLQKHLRARWQWTFLALSILGLAAAEVRLRHIEKPTGTLRVTFVDVGQGDSALLDMPDGQLLLIDAGGDPLGYRDPGKQVLWPLLRARRRDRIDVAVITHPHPDHYGGMGQLLESVPIGELWDSGQADLERDLTATARLAGEFLDTARKKHIPVRTADSLCNKPRHFGTATVHVLSPCPAVDQGLTENDNSLVLLVTYGKHRLLFAGDIEAESEARLLDRGVLEPVDVLKVAHHGSRTSSTDAFLNHIKPRVAIISSGQSNRFGHPHAQTLRHLEATKASVFSLAQEGGVTLETDGRTMQLRSWSTRQQSL